MKIVKMLFNAKNGLRLPFAHMEILQGVVYRMMSYDEELSAEIHDKRFENSKPFKFFCFSDIIGRYRIANKEVIYNGFFEWEIRCGDDRIANAVFKYISNYHMIEINHQECEILSAQICRKVFFKDEINIKMNTPVVIYHTDKTGFVSYENPLKEEFYAGIIKNIRNKYEVFYGKKCEDNIVIKCRKLTEKDKCVTRYKGTLITCWYGEYNITAPTELLKFIYHTGIGGKNSMGFGTFFELNYC